jgi:hypothetical protein
MPNEQGYIRSSEIGAFLFCRRAWDLQEQGVPATEKGRARREAGTAFHAQHRLRRKKSPQRKLLAVTLLILAYLLLMVYLFQTYLSR